MFFVILYYMLFLFKYNIYIYIYYHVHCISISHIIYNSITTRDTLPIHGPIFCYCAGKFPPHSAIPRFLLRGPGPSGRGKERKRVERLESF